MTTRLIDWWNDWKERRGYPPTDYQVRDRFRELLWQGCAPYSGRSWDMRTDGLHLRGQRLRKELRENWVTALYDLSFSMCNAITRAGRSKWSKHVERLNQDHERVRNGDWERVDIGYVPTSVHMLFPHLSVNDSSKVAYYESEDKFLRDIQTPISPGKYWRKVFPNASSEEVREFTEKVKAMSEPAPLCVSHDAHDFVRVYQNGPDACMTFEDREFNDHPCRAYAAGDIEILWLEKDGDITARALANRHTKCVSRMYGDETALRRAFEAKGYKLADCAEEDPALLGCRLQDCEGEYGTLLPYVDRGHGYKEALRVDWGEGNKTGYLVICESGGYSTVRGYENDGYLYKPDGDDDEDDCLCEDCRDSYNADELNPTWYGTYVCENCLDHDYTYARVSRCEQAYVRNEAAVYCASDDTWYEDNFAGEYLYCCAECGDYFLERDVVEIELSINDYGDGHHLCERCKAVDPVTGEVCVRYDLVLDDYRDEEIYKGYQVSTISGKRAHQHEVYDIFADGLAITVHPNDVGYFRDRVEPLLMRPDCMVVYNDNPVDASDLLQDWYGGGPVFPVLARLPASPGDVLMQDSLPDLLAA